MPDPTPINKKRRQKANGKPAEANTIEQAIDAATPGKAMVTLPIMVDVEQWPASIRGTLKAVPSQNPHLLVWVAERNAYQGVMLEIGQTWTIAVDGDQPARRGLWLPGQQQ